MVLSRRKSVSNTQKNTLFTNTYPESILSEQYRMIQTNIKFSMDEGKKQTLLITSPSDGEGKSLIAANLAVSMAQQKRKVLLIDANLRKPALNSYFQTPNSNGLTDILTGRLSLGEVVVHTEIWRLDFLPSGLIPKNPVELLGSQLMTDLLKKASQIYDVILIDSNAVLDVTDTKLLSNQCNGVILVIKNGKTKVEKATEAKKVLEFAKAKIVGVVLNQ